jgi:hypothetical protein
MLNKQQWVNCISEKIVSVGCMNINTQAYEYGFLLQTLTPDSNWRNEVKTDFIKIIHYKDKLKKSSVSLVEGIDFFSNLSLTSYKNNTLTNAVNYVMSSTQGNILVFQENSVNENLINKKNEEDFGIALSGLKKIGSTIYAIGGPRKVYKFVANKDWVQQPISLNSELIGFDATYWTNTSKIKRSEILHTLSASIFRDICLHNGKLYVVGDGGEFWVNSENAWSQLDFPTNDDLRLVCSDGDDSFYIADSSGNVWKNKAEKWSLVCESNMDISQGIFFQNRFWCICNDGLMFLDGDNLVDCTKLGTAPVSEDFTSSVNHISLSNDNETMLVCGDLGAAVYDGEKWAILFYTDKFGDEA